MFFMKKLFYILLPLLALLIALIFLYVSKGNKNDDLKIPIKEENINDSFSPTPISTKEVNRGYQTTWILARSVSKIKLFLNLEEKLSSNDAATKHNCDNLVSGGFYDTENNPIGLFITDGKKLEESKVSQLFNGYFYIDPEGAHIESLPPTKATIGLQAGPILYINQKPVKLSLEKDEAARRIVVATTKEGKVIFIVAYTKGNPLSGPRLTELPEIIDELSKNAKLDIVDALNLDGGAHSAFLTKSFQLTEISTIGSYFCTEP